MLFWINGATDRCFWFRNLVPVIGAEEPLRLQFRASCRMAPAGTAMIVTTCSLIRHGEPSLSLRFLCRGSLSVNWLGVRESDKNDKARKGKEEGFKQPVPIWHGPSSNVIGGRIRRRVCIPVTPSRTELQPQHVRRVTLHL